MQFYLQAVKDLKEENTKVLVQLIKQKFGEELQMLVGMVCMNILEEEGQVLVVEHLNQMPFLLEDYMQAILNKKKEWQLLMAGLRIHVHGICVERILNPASLR